MKVCKQMVGCDSNEQPKVWIHPDPVSYRVWLPCNSEPVMLHDILNILEAVEEKHYHKATGNRQHLQEYTTF